MSFRTPARPIFLHSLFRAGSTYFFQVFRRSPAGFRCYQEPLNEILLEINAKEDPLGDNAVFVERLRHPTLDKPYLAEFFTIRDQVATAFKKQFPYDAYFLRSLDAAPDLFCYLNLLVGSGEGRPVLQFCRSMGRLPWLTQHFDAYHVFIWRNPWDQWWSYKVDEYFDITNLMIMKAQGLPPVLQQVRDLVKLDTFCSAGIGDEFNYYKGIKLADAEGYLIFYALWLFSFFEGCAAADLIISIDKLSRSKDYLDEVIASLGLAGIGDLDFSDCRVHQAYFSSSDADFFSAIEDRVRGIFEQHGYEFSLLDELAGAARVSRRDIVADENRRQSIVVDLGQVRRTALQYRRTLIGARHDIWVMQQEINRLGRLESELRSIYDSKLWKLLLPFLQIYWKSRAFFRKRKLTDSG